MYGLVVFLNEKRFIIPELSLLITCLEKRDVTFGIRDEILFDDLGMVYGLEIVDLEQISRKEIVRIRGIHLSIRGY